MTKSLPLENFLRQATPIPGNYDVLKAAATLPGKTALDIGFGLGSAAMTFALSGKSVAGLTVGRHFILKTQRHFAVLNIAAVDCPFLSHSCSSQYDLIWMSHMMEHGPNPGLTLLKARDLLSEEGWLCVLVPPFKHKVVRGHLSVGWNVGLLAYFLIAHGFDVRNAHFIRHGYNIAAFAQKSSVNVRFLDHYESTDLIVGEIMDPERALKYWPDEMVAGMDELGGFNGDLAFANWPQSFRTAMDTPLDVSVSSELVDAILALGPVA